MLLSPPAIQFKGSGWYVTDYARKGSSESPKADGGSSEKSQASAGDTKKAEPSAARKPHESKPSKD
jgi:predicted nucleic acid-binding Zn ribbon protein